MLEYRRYLFVLDTIPNKDIERKCFAIKYIPGRFCFIDFVYAYWTCIHSDFDIYPLNVIGKSEDTFPKTNARHTS